MQSKQKKAQVAAAVCDLVGSEEVIGIGSGSTVSCFIEALASRSQPPAVVPASEASAACARACGLEVRDLNDTGTLVVCVDGADEATQHRALIKGGGGALTREKILVAASRRFICIIDGSKLVNVLGHGFPVAIEVLPMARAFVARQLVTMGASPALRTGYVTDNGNVIIDVQGLKLTDPAAVETQLNQVPGVISNGLFAVRRADMLLVAGADGVQTIT